MGLDKSGQSVRVGPKGTLVATLPKAQQERYFAARPRIKENWDEQWGDRGSKLVFIGREFDQESLVTDLEDTEGPNLLKERSIGGILVHFVAIPTGVIGAGQVDLLATIDIH